MQFIFTLPLLSSLVHVIARCWSHRVKSCHPLIIDGIEEVVLFKAISETERILGVEVEAGSFILRLFGGGYLSIF